MKHHDNCDETPAHLPSIPCPSRRAFLGGAATLASATVFGAPAAGARPPNGKPVFVQVFLRGAMDGLTTVVPYGDGDLYVRRPTLAVQPPGSVDGALDLDGFFGLAPSAAPLLTPFGDGRLVIVHASGALDATRSHFDAFENMESGDFSHSLRSGWLSRYLIEVAAQSTSPVRAIGTRSRLPLTLKGAPNAVAIPNLARFQFPGVVETGLQRKQATIDTYSRVSAPVGPAALDTVAALGLGGIDFDGYAPENGAQYPTTQFGRHLRHTAALIKGDIGVEAVTVDLEGWDLHAMMGPINGAMAELLDELTRGLEAFYLDLLGHIDDYVLVCISEFGRRTQENASSGTDHGHGNAMFVMGGRVNGGQVIADWPGLSPEALDNGDLAITIDYRDVLGEIVQELLGIADVSPIFPNYTVTHQGVTT